MKKHADLPQHIIKVNRFFYKDTKTNKFIHRDNLAQHTPKSKVEIPSWHVRYDNY